MTKGEQLGTKAPIAIFIVIVLVIAIMAWYFYQRITTEKEMTAKGCTPEAWNSWGGVTRWSCPAP